MMNADNMARLGFFVILLAGFMILEYVRPQRLSLLSRQIRWPINFGLAFMNSLLLAILPVSAVGMALYAEAHSTGLLHILELPLPVKVVIGVICLDFVIYWQHRLFHRIPALWRLHILHHTDGNLDTSSALRFHPLEIVVSLVIKMATILALGVSPLTVIVFEVILNGMAMFNHSNLQLPHTMDAALRKFVVTPDMHRIHHSQLPAEMHSNFGFNLSIWDRLFNSWTAQASCETFALGIRHITFTQQKDPIFLLALPFAPVAMITGDVQA